MGKPVNPVMLNIGGCLAPTYAKTEVQLKSLGKAGLWSTLPRQVINGIIVYGGHSSPVADYFVPSLGSQVILWGPLGRKVLETLTFSPRTVALASGPAPEVPSPWQKVNLAGIDFSTPADWHILRTAYSEGIGGPCPPEGIAFRTTSVTLSTDVKPLSFVSCSASDQNLPTEPHNGIQIDRGAPNELIVPLAKKCLKLHGLIACPEGYPYSVLVLKVTVPGRSTPAIVSIGLTGNGMAARTILYSLRPPSAQGRSSIVTMPRLIYMTERKALQSLGLFATVSTVAAPIKPGVVVAQSPVAGSRVVRGSTVILKVSRAKMGPAVEPSRCSASQLLVVLFGGSGAAGTAITGIGIDNKSDTSCWLSGRPRVSFFTTAKSGKYMRLSVELGYGGPPEVFPARSPVVLLHKGKPVTDVLGHTYPAYSAGIVITSRDFPAGRETCQVVTLLQVRLPGLSDTTFKVPLKPDGMNACDTPPPVDVSPVVTRAVVLGTVGVDVAPAS